MSTAVTRGPNYANNLDQCHAGRYIGTLMPLQIISQLADSLIAHLERQETMKSIPATRHLVQDLLAPGQEILPAWNGILERVSKPLAPKETVAP